MSPKQPEIPTFQMSLTNGISNPEPLVSALEDLLNQIPDQAMIQFARGYPPLAKGGFQAKPSSLQLLRQRIKGLSLAPQGPAGPIREFLCDHSLQSELIIVLSEQAVAAGYDLFAACLGRERLLLAMLLDPRERMQELARHFWNQPPPQTVPQDPQSGLQELFQPFLQLLGSIHHLPADPRMQPESEIKPRETAPAIPDSDMENLRKKAKKAKGLEKKVEKQESALEERDRRIVELQRALEKAQKRADRLHAEWEKDHNILEQTLNRQEKDVRKRLEAELRTEAWAWLKPAQELAEADVELRRLAEKDDLLAAVETALEKQADMDRHTGNRLSLEKRLAQLRQALQKVRGSRENALNPLPALADLEKKLGQEIQKIEKMLGHEGGKNLQAAADQWIAAINECSDESLPTIETHFEALYDMNVLSRRLWERLSTAIEKRKQRAYARYNLPDQEAEPENKHHPSVQFFLDHADTKPFTLLLDGHNLLFALKQRYQSLYEPNGTPGRAAREAMIRDTVALAGRCPKGHIHLVFDGDRRTDQNASRNVTVTYSGGEGVNRADEVIVQYITFACGADLGEPVFLVSNDRELCTNARGEGARVLSGLHFQAILRELGVSAG